MPRRFGIPEEIAQAALFLASGELSFLHIDSAPAEGVQLPDLAERAALASAVKRKGRHAGLDQVPESALCVLSLLCYPLSSDSFSVEMLSGPGLLLTKWFAQNITPALEALRVIVWGISYSDQVRRRYL
jgi:hypothetical protein